MTKDERNKVKSKTAKKNHITMNSYNLSCVQDYDSFIGTYKSHL